MERFDRNMAHFPRVDLTRLPSAIWSRPWATTSAVFPEAVHRSPAVLFGPDRNPAAAGDAAFDDVHVRVAAHGGDHGGGQGGLLHLALGQELALGEQASLQSTVGIGDLQPDPQGASLRLQRRADLREGGLERLREAGDPECGLQANLHQRQGFGGQVRQDLQAAVVHHHQGELPG